MTLGTRCVITAKQIKQKKKTEPWVKAQTLSASQSEIWLLDVDHPHTDVAQKATTKNSSFVSTNANEAPWHCFGSLLCSTGLNLPSYQHKSTLRQLVQHQTFTNTFLNDTLLSTNRIVNRIPENIIIYYYIVIIQRFLLQHFQVSRCIFCCNHSIEPVSTGLSQLHKLFKLREAAWGLWVNQICYMPNTVDLMSKKLSSSLSVDFRVPLTKLRHSPIKLHPVKDPGNNCLYSFSHLSF